jgi:hypothetical protein
LLQLSRAQTQRIADLFVNCLFCVAAWRISDSTQESVRLSNWSDCQTRRPANSKVGVGFKTSELIAMLLISTSLHDSTDFLERENSLVTTASGNALFGGKK